MNLAVMCLDFGTPKTITSPFWIDGKLILLGVPILKHVMVLCKAANH